MGQGRDNEYDAGYTALAMAACQDAIKAYKAIAKSVIKKLEQPYWTSRQYSKYVSERHELLEIENLFTKSFGAHLVKEPELFIKNLRKGAGLIDDCEIISLAAASARVQNKNDGRVHREDGSDGAESDNIL